MRLETNFDSSKDDGAINGKGTEGVKDSKRGRGISMNCEAFRRRNQSSSPLKSSKNGNSFIVKDVEVSFNIYYGVHNVPSQVRRGPKSESKGRCISPNL